MNGFVPVLQDVTGDYDTLAFSPSRKWLAAVDLRSIRIFDAASGTTLRTIKVNGPIQRLELNERIISGVDGTGSPFGYDPETGKQITATQKRSDLKLVMSSVWQSHLAKRYKQVLAKSSSTDTNKKIVWDAGQRHMAVPIATKWSSENPTHNRYDIWDLKRQTKVARLDLNNLCEGETLSSFDIAEGSIALSMSALYEGISLNIALLNFKDRSGKLRWKRCEEGYGVSNALSPNGGLFAQGIGLDNENTRVWELNTQWQTAFFPGGAGRVVFSPDSGSFAARTQLGDAKAAVVSHDGQSVLIRDPKGTIAAISNNGKWLAVARPDHEHPEENRAISVLDVGKPTEAHDYPSSSKSLDEPIHAYVSDAGAPVAVYQDEYLAKGVWHSIENNPADILSLSSNFKRLCNLVLCDEVRTEEGVAVRSYNYDEILKLVEVKAHDVTPVFVSSPDGQFLLINHGDEVVHTVDIFDGATLRLLARAAVPFDVKKAHFSADGKSILVDDLGAIDAQTGAMLWTVDQAGEAGFIRRFPDGHIDYSNGVEDRIKLVRGFEIRDFDRAAAKVFRARH